MRNQNAPEFSGPFKYGHGFIAPSQMLAAIAAEGHTPTISRKPGISLGSSTMSDCARTIGESVKVTFYTSWVCEKMPVTGANAKQSIRVSDEAPTTVALVDFGTITTNSFWRGDMGDHWCFPDLAGFILGNIPNPPQKSILPSRITFSPFCLFFYLI